MLTVQSFTFNPLEENTYVLFDEMKAAIIIDPGCYFDHEKKKLEIYFKSNGLTPVQLLNTHCHLDHVFGNEWMFETYSLELFLHRDEEQVLQFAPQTAQMWGMQLKNYQGPLHFLNSHDIIKLGNNELKVLPAPGHSPGSICFYCEEQKFVIGGDVLFRESIGRTDLPGGDHKTLIESIQQQLFVLPDDVTVYPGHGAATTLGYEKKYNPFLQS